jgi:raffinose/stachyose/melibiose transport system permease protein
VLKIAVLALLAFVVLYPLSMVVISTLKTEPQYMADPTGLPQNPTLANYPEVFKAARIPGAAMNSVLLTFTSVIVLLFFSSLAAFALTKMGFRRSGIFSTAFMTPMLLSAQLVVLPTFLIFARLHLLDTYIGAIMLYSAGGLPLAILLLANFLNTIPSELCDSARVDGASQFQVYYHIVLPLLTTPMATVAIITGLSIWNDFFVPFMYFPSGKLKTLPLGIYRFTQTYTAQWTLISTDIMFIVAPVLIFYLLLQRYIMGGVMSGALVE